MTSITNSIDNCTASLQFLSNVGVLDSNGNPILGVSPTTNAVNYLVLANGARFNGPTFYTTSGGTTITQANIGINVVTNRRLFTLYITDYSITSASLVTAVMTYSIGGPGVVVVSTTCTTNLITVVCNKDYYGTWTLVYYDAAVDLHITPKGTGKVYIDGGGLNLSQSFAYLTMPHYPVITAASNNRQVQQQTSIGTAVTTTFKFGVIETATASFTAYQIYAFTLNNAFINANSIVLVSCQGNAQSQINVPMAVSASAISSGSCSILITNMADATTGNINLYIGYGIF